MKSKKAAGAIVQKSQSLSRNHQHKSVTPPATQGQSWIKKDGQSSDKLPARRVFESPSLQSRRSSDLQNVKRGTLISNDGSNLASQHNRQASMNVASSYTFSNQRSIRDILMKFTTPAGILSSQNSKRGSSANPDEAYQQFDHSNVSSQV